MDAILKQVSKKREKLEAELASLKERQKAVQTDLKDLDSVQGILSSTGDPKPSNPPDR